MWFCCDACMQPIKELALRFDCQQCDNFTFCEKCYRKNTTHLHRFVKAKVPAGQGPPENYSKLIDQAYMRCCVCSDSLINVTKRVYTCTDKACSQDLTSG